MNATVTISNEPVGDMLEKALFSGGKHIYNQWQQLIECRYLPPFIVLSLGFFGWPRSGSVDWRWSPVIEI
jgi:hypothetical protein